MDKDTSLRTIEISKNTFFCIVSTSLLDSTISLQSFDLFNISVEYIRHKWKGTLLYMFYSQYTDDTLKLSFIN